MKETLREISDTYRSMFSARVAALVVLGAVVGAVAGPFGTFDAMEMEYRIFYWGLIAVSSVFLGYTGFAVALAFGLGRGTLALSVVGTSLAAILITADVQLISNLGNWGDLRHPAYGKLFGYVVLITGAVGVLRHFLVQHLTSSEETIISDDPIPVIPFLPRLSRRLPDAYQDGIFHLSVNDHHVVVASKAGETSLRMRLGDAIDEMDGVTGYRVHRSHWVAHFAVEGVEFDQARVFLCLRGDRRVPVSRNYRPVLEEAGLL